MKGGSSLLPSIVEELVEEPLHPLLEEAVEAGEALLGYTCNYIPEPLLAVKGLVPLRMRAPHLAGTPLADTYLSSVLCPYTRSLLEFALEGVWDLLGGWIFTASCDHLRRLYDNLVYLQPPPFHHILDLPHRTTPAAIEWYREELEQLARALARHFEIDMGEAALLQAIAEENELLELLRELGESRKEEHPPLSGGAFHRLLVACSAAPKRALLPHLRQLQQQLQEPKREEGNVRARLLVAGSQIADPCYLDLIEGMGGLVVADRFCLGSLPGLRPIVVEEEPLLALARHSLEHNSCPRMMEHFPRRLQEILELVEEYRVDGVVVETMKFCDLWGVEAAALVTALRRASIPVLRLEREYALTGEGQLRTRIQAFLESMGR